MRRSIQSAITVLEDDCGSDHELLYEPRIFIEEEKIKLNSQ